MGGKKGIMEVWMAPSLISNLIKMVRPGQGAFINDVTKLGGGTVYEALGKNVFKSDRRVESVGHKTLQICMMSFINCPLSN